MTTEDDFQHALDANPGDWQMRLVFADWLEEHGDPRAPGYRALGQRHRQALPCQSTNGPLRYIVGTETITPKVHRVKWGACLLAQDWFALVERSPACATHHDKWKYYLTRREAEDAAARAFPQLPAKRQTQLLAPPERDDK
jgi:uncharacterized protein (TIGR02996 family)